MLRRFAGGAQAAKPCVHARVVREDRAAVAVTAERFGREERSCGHIAERAGNAPADPPAEALRSILKDREAVSKALRREIGKAFAEILECAGVYKRTEAGRAAFRRFYESL